MGRSIFCDTLRCGRKQRHNDTIIVKVPELSNATETSSAQSDYPILGSYISCAKLQANTKALKLTQVSLDHLSPKKHAQDTPSVGDVLPKFQVS